MPPKKSTANKAKVAKPKASASKASTAKAGTAKADAKVKTASANAKAKTASQPQTPTARYEEVNGGENMEIDSTEDDDIDDEGGDDIAEPKAKLKKAKTQTVSKVSNADEGVVNKAPASQRIATRAANANQHPGEKHKALDGKRRTKEQMMEIRRQEEEQKKTKEEAARQKMAAQDKAIDRVAQFEAELANDTYNNTPLPRNRRILGRSTGLQVAHVVADHGESDQDDGVDDGAGGPDQRGSDVSDDGEVADDGDKLISTDIEMSDEVVSVKVSKRKGRATQAKVDADVILETSASEGEDRPKKKAKGKAVESFVPSESEVEIVDDSEPKPRGKNPKGKGTIRDAINDKKNVGTSNQNLRTDKARSSDAPGNFKPERYEFRLIYHVNLGRNHHFLL